MELIFEVLASFYDPFAKVLVRNRVAFYREAFYRYLLPQFLYRYLFTTATTCYSYLFYRYYLTQLLFSTAIV